MNHFVSFYIDSCYHNSYCYYRIRVPDGEMTSKDLWIYIQGHIDEELEDRMHADDEDIDDECTWKTAETPNMYH